MDITAFEVGVASGIEKTAKSVVLDHKTIKQMQNAAEKAGVPVGDLLDKGKKLFHDAVKGAKDVADSSQVKAVKDTVRTGADLADKAGKAISDTGTALKKTRQGVTDIAESVGFKAKKVEPSKYIVPAAAAAGGAGLAATAYNSGRGRGY